MKQVAPAAAARPVDPDGFVTYTKGLPDRGRNRHSPVLFTPGFIHNPTSQGR